MAQPKEGDGKEKNERVEGDSVVGEGGVGGSVLGLNVSPLLDGEREEKKEKLGSFLAHPPNTLFKQ